METLTYVVICGYPHTSIHQPSTDNRIPVRAVEEVTIIYSIKNAQCWEFLGGPILEMQVSPRGAVLIPGQGNKTL